MIDCEAIQLRADAHHQNSLCGKPIMLKTTQSFLKPSCELYQASWNLSKRVKFFIAIKFSKSTCSCYSTEYVAPALWTVSL